MVPIEVCAAVIRRGAQILLATRPPGCRAAGRWEFPGGKVSGAESLDACIRREIAEELGLAVKNISLAWFSPIRLIKCMIPVTL